LFVTSCYQVSTTVESEAEAQRIAETLVAERLAACAQVSGPLLSVYRWEGVVTRATEWRCAAKTTETRLFALMQRIRVLHAYRVPEIVAMPIPDGDPAYLDWVRQESTPTSELP
jgi:periplasmic divalent cation tolerance protein